VRRLTDYLADQQKRDLDDRDLTSRSDLRKARKEAENAFAELAQSLCGCTDKQLRRLVLPEALTQVLLEARSIESPSAKDRALRLVRRELRSADTDALRRQLLSLNKPKPQPLPKESDTWCDRLFHEGEPALNEFIEKHPDADRQQLRQLLRKAQKADETSRAKALQALSKLLTR
jgi:ribosome-associated protein